MKIIYKENPLRSVVDLDEWEKKEFWYKIKIEQMEWIIFGARFHLNHEFGSFDVNRAREELEYDEEKVNEYVNQLHAAYLNDIVDIHCGDCTCVPASCSKCHGESLLGVDTIPGLGKHEASKIWSAFGPRPGGTDTRTLDEAIEVLANYKPHADWEGWEAHVERWLGEAKNAHQWLVDYKQKHFC